MGLSVLVQRRIAGMRKRKYWLKISTVIYYELLIINIICCTLLETYH